MIRQPDHPVNPQSGYVQRFIAELLVAWNEHDLDQIAAFYAEDNEGIDVAQESAQYGLDGVRQMLGGHFHALPDLRFVQDELIVEGDRAAVVWTAHGTHRGSLMHIPASGRPVTSAFRLKNGKISRATYVWDVAGLLRDIGLLPDL
jgi:steroid delta-isomerase-like uncharacterized protein